MTADLLRNQSFAVITNNILVPKSFYMTTINGWSQEMDQNKRCTPTSQYMKKLERQTSKSDGARDLLSRQHNQKDNDCRWHIPTYWSGNTRSAQIHGSYLERWWRRGPSIAPDAPPGGRRQPPQWISPFLRRSASSTLPSSPPSLPPS